MEGEALVARCEVRPESDDGVVTGSGLGDDDVIAFEEAVRLVARQEVFVGTGEQLDARPPYDLAIVPQILSIGEHELPQAVESVEAGEQQAPEELIVMVNGQAVRGVQSGQLLASERSFAVRRSSAELLATGERPCHKWVPPVLPDVGIEWFELVADAREVRVDGLGLDMVTHVDRVQAEGVGGGVEREMV